MQEITSIRDAEVAGKRVLLRADLNVPLKNGAVADDTRLRAALPTLEYLHERSAKTITLLAHLGRPGGKVVENLRLAPIEAKMRELTAVPFVMHENLRFSPGEEADDAAFAKQLADGGDLFVNDAFADAHRAHASIVTLPTLLPSYAGLLMEKEIKHLSEALHPPQGALAVIGGAKFETKIPLLKKLVALYGKILLGGALANDFLKVRGSPVADSLVSSAPVPEELAGEERIKLPLDVALFNKETKTGRTSPVNDIRLGEASMDIGTSTAAKWSGEIAHAPFVLWNGPLGVYEDGYVEGTDTIAKAIAEGAVRAVIGGGDTDAALKKFTFDTNRVFISTGGGAMLQFLTDGTLPGIEALKR